MVQYGAILNFPIFRKNYENKKNGYISKTVLDRISTKFLTHRVFLRSSHPNFQKKIVSTKMTAIFEFFAKIAKHKNAYILKTVLDRGISMIFLNRRVSLQSSHPNFQKKICLAKNGGHFEFFAKFTKHKNAFILKTVLDRAISTKFLTHRVSLQSSYSSFQKNFASQKMAAILNFRILCKNCKTQNCLYRKLCYIEQF